MPKCLLFFDELSRNGSVSALALKFLILTATRTLEVLHAEWREIELPAGVWIIPASRMKTRREHRVPLSDSAMTVLEAPAPHRRLFLCVPGITKR